MNEKHTYVRAVCLLCMSAGAVGAAAAMELLAKTALLLMVVDSLVLLLYVCKPLSRSAVYVVVL